MLLNRLIMIKFALITMRPKIGEKKKNLEIMKNYILKEKADFYIFGEMSLTGYRCKDELRDLAEDSNQQDVYSNLSILHLQTHNASALAHYFNIDTFNSYIFYASQIILMVDSLRRGVEVLPELEDNERITFYLLHDKINKQYKDALEKGSKKSKK